MGMRRPNVAEVLRWGNLLFAVATSRGGENVPRGIGDFRQAIILLRYCQANTGADASWRRALELALALHLLGLEGARRVYPDLVAAMELEALS